MKYVIRGIGPFGKVDYMGTRDVNGDFNSLGCGTDIGGGKPFNSRKAAEKVLEEYRRQGYDVECRDYVVEYN